jgi:starvation-inducible DNA-binding protein
MAWKREILSGPKRDKTVAALQAVLSDLIDLSLQGKQAHWNVKGPQFKSIHEQLDEVVNAARLASDEVAERISTLGLPADGRIATVGSSTRLPEYPGDFVTKEDTVRLIADRLAQTIEGLRAAEQITDETDPVSQDLLIGISGGFEKTLWMLQAQEG